MDWSVWVPIIAREGLPLAAELWRKWQSGQQPTADDWTALEGLTRQTARDRMVQALQRADIDPESERGKALLALTT